MLTGRPFDDLRAILAQLPDADDCAAKKVREALAGKPVDSTSGLAELAAWAASWQGSSNPSIAESHICVLASSYEGQDTSSVTDYIEATSKGAAAVNLLCVEKGIGLRAIQLAPEMPHPSDGDWSEQDCMAAVAFGMEATAAGGNILGLTDMAPGNAERAVAIILAVKGLQSDDTLLAAVDKDFANNVKVLLARVQGAEGDPLEVMRRLGGREIAAAVGALVAARSRRLPVLTDGWAAIAATVVLDALVDGATGHVLPAASDNPMQALAWHLIGKTPIVGLEIGGGPGCGIAIGVSVLGAACAMLGLRDRTQ
ncbi:nicotinate-nucleotide--dimethylbenzimidazole phosphoribosyltransferase [Kordiimonas lipolytica]|uniref:Nicotinate-nucleotide--dimethylbenzimidazole phosphoribosyltransferase n=2 Tax=Kordiimonas lipolytica TaxID=1662421 RepID=A0ABV8UEK9_9PROT